jgi:hypothetical protein
MPYTLICFKPGDKSIFPVDIEKTKTVGHLKDEIKKKKPQTFANVEADHLTLFKTKVDISDDDEPEILDRISKGIYKFELMLMLKPARKISCYFKEDAEETLEVLVEISGPPGEPMNSRACDDVVLMTPVTGCRFQRSAGVSGPSCTPPHCGRGQSSNHRIYQLSSPENL